MLYLLPSPPKSPTFSISCPLHLYQNHHRFTAIKNLFSQNTFAFSFCCPKPLGSPRRLLSFALSVLKLFILLDLSLALTLAQPARLSKVVISFTILNKPQTNTE